MGELVRERKEISQQTIHRTWGLMNERSGPLLPIGMDSEVTRDFPICRCLLLVTCMLLGLELAHAAYRKTLGASRPRRVADKPSSVAKHASNPENEAETDSITAQMTPSLTTACVKAKIKSKKLWPNTSKIEEIVKNSFSYHHSLLIL